MATAPVYRPIPVESLVGNTKVEFNLYLRLNSKHVLYVRKGDVFSDKRLSRIRARNMQHLWIVDQDEPVYRLALERHLNAAYDLHSTMLPEARAQLILSAQTTATEALLKSLDDPDAYFAAMENAVRLTDQLLRDDVILRPLLVNAAGRPRAVATHGVAVAAIAVTLAKLLGMSDSKNLHLLTLGCMIHDAGHFDNSESGFGRGAQKNLTPHESAAFRAHPAIGTLAARELVHFDQHVVKIILEHEEHTDGSGFPKGLTERQMHAYSVLASTANAFDRMLSFEGESLETAARRLLIERIGLHPLDHLKAVKALIENIERNRR